MQEKKDDKRSKIINSALALFLKKTFDKTTIAEITELSGISKGNFYTYFSSKEELLKEIVDNVIESIKSMLKNSIKEKDNPIEAIEEFFIINISLIKTYTQSIIISLRETGVAPIDSRKGISESINNAIKEALKFFVISLKGECSEEDLLLIWGITLAFWIEVSMESKTPDTKKLSEKLWNGIKNT